MRQRNSNFNWLPILAACCAFLTAPRAMLTPLRAQDADQAAMDDAADKPPAGDDALAGDHVAADEKLKPAPKPKAKKPDADTEKKPLDDPAVLAVLESHPKTPSELLRAIDILVDLDRASLAKPFVDTLVQTKLNQAAKAALAHQFNSATLLKLAHDSELGPVLGPFVDDVLTSAEAYRRDPRRLVAWAKQLHDSNESVRAQAALALLRAREAAVAPLVEILADPKRVAERRAAKEVLVQLDAEAVAPLLGVLEGTDESLKTQVIEVLGRLQAHQAVAQLLFPLLSPATTPELKVAASKALEQIAGHVPSPPEALRLLERAARRPLEQSRQEDDVRGASVEIWHWNAKRKASMPVKYDATGASLAVATRAARDLYQLDPGDAAHRRLYSTALLQTAKFRIGFDKPLPTGAGTAYAAVAHQGADVVEDLLTQAVAQGFMPAATAAAQILGDIGSAELLARGSSAPSPLATAAQSSDRRLRFTAIDAILKLKPAEPFAGSSQVADGLGGFASSYGTPRVLVVHPRSEMGQQVAGLAAQLGYESDLATNGRRAFKLAVSSPDYEYVLIHSAVERPGVDELLAQLRRDRRTALLPVGLIAPWDDLERVTRFAKTAVRTEAFLQPQNLPEMKLFSGRVLARAGRSLVSTEERRRQAIAALDWMIALGEGPGRVFDLQKQESAVLQVLYVGELSTRAAKVLGQLGTARGQRSLSELANLPTQPLATRQAAVAAFAHSVALHGIMLTREEILRLYDMYNANAGRDADTGTVLGSLLDVIEHKNDSADEE